MADDKPSYRTGFDPSKVSASDLFQAQPQIQFKLPDGPYEVIEDPPGVVNVFAQGRKHPILTMPRSVADSLGWTEPEPPDPPTSATRLSPRRPNDGENHD